MRVKLIYSNINKNIGLSLWPPRQSKKKHSHNHPKVQNLENLINIEAFIVIYFSTSSRQIREMIFYGDDEKERIAGASRLFLKMSDALVSNVHNNTL